MLSRLILLLACLLCGIGARASSLKGVVLANEEGGSTVVKAKVSADGANPTETGESGHFTLQFPGKQPGDTVQLVLTKPGYVVVNWIQLSVALPKDPEAAPVTLLICKEAQREEWARRFYRLKSLGAVEENYKRRVKVLEETNQQNADAMAELRRERDQAKVEVEKASEAIARLRPGTVTDLYSQAMTLFVNGKVDEALQSLDEKKLEQSLTDARHEKQKAQNAEAQAVQGYLLRAQLLSTKFKFNEAEKVYESALQKAPDNIDLHFSFGQFSRGLNRFPQAKAEYTRALDLARGSGNQEDLVLALNKLGDLDVVQNQLDEARDHHEGALKICRQLAQKKQEIPLSQLAITLVDLGVVDQAQNRPTEARQHMEEALRIWRRLSQQSPEVSLPGFAGMLVNLGNLDKDQNRPDDARQHYEEALTTYRQLAKKEPNTYLPHVGETLNNLGFLDDDQHRMEAARSHLEEALKTNRQLAQQNPEAFLPDVATTLINVGNLDREERRLQESRLHFEEALDTFRLLAQGTPETYLVAVAETLNDLGLLDRDQERPSEARQHFEEALKIFRQLTNQKQAAECLKCMANTLNNLAILDLDQARQNEGRQHFEEALNLALQLAQQSPSTYLPSVAAIQNNLAVLDRRQNRTDEARKYFADALNTYRELAQSNPDEYLPNVADTLGNLARLDWDDKHLDLAEQRYEQALNIYRPLVQQRPESYYPSIVKVLMNLGELDEEQNRAQEAQQHLQEALNICRRLAQQNPGIYLPLEASLLRFWGILDTKQSRMGQAILHYDQALQLDPQDVATLKSRGYAQFYQGHFGDAEKDFTATISKEPTSVYVGLWFYLSQARQGKDAKAELQKSVANYDLTKWPGQVVQLYLGLLKKEDVFAAAEDAEPKKKNEKYCEAYFYLGELALLTDNRSDAEDLFQKSIGTDVRSFVEFQGATSELGWLKAHP